MNRVAALRQPIRDEPRIVTDAAWLWRIFASDQMPCVQGQRAERELIALGFGNNKEPATE